MFLIHEINSCDLHRHKGRCDFITTKKTNRQTFKTFSLNYSDFFW